MGRPDTDTQTDDERWRVTMSDDMHNIKLFIITYYYYMIGSLTVRPPTARAVYTEKLNANPTRERERKRKKRIN